MFVKAVNGTRAIQKVRIEVGTIVGLEEDKEAFIELSEMPTLMMMELKDEATKGEKAIMEFFKTCLSSIIVDHNFYETEEKKMSNEALAEFIFTKNALTSKVVSEYTSASFFSRPRQNGDK